MARVALASGAYQARSLISGAQRVLSITTVFERRYTPRTEGVMRAIDLTGQRFGRLLVGQFVGSGGEGRQGRRYACLCDCGSEVVCVSGDLRSGDSKSCGCLNLDRAREVRHGMTGHPVHNAWKWMLTRCTNPNIKGAKNYSGRGIGFCERWKIFENFRDDMLASYQPGLTLERVDNDLGYGPDNCRWADRDAQSRNRRSVRMINTPRGQMSIADAARAAGTSWFAIHNRVRRGWPVDRILDGPNERFR